MLPGRRRFIRWPNRGSATIKALRDSLGFCAGPETPLQVRLEGQWQQDGLLGEELSWWVGYGPRTHAFFLRPEGASGPLPAVLALHDHDGFKWFGKEKIAQGPGEPPEILQRYWTRYYGGRAWANALARQGFAVLVHDTFLWGSRRFQWEEMPEQVHLAADAMLEKYPPEDGTPLEIARYHLAAGEHEHVVEKYLHLLGTCLAGAVAARIALPSITCFHGPRLTRYGLAVWGCRAAATAPPCCWPATRG